MDPIIGGALVGGAINLAGDIFSQSNARSAFKTRYQDTVADMRKAGLNPALAYGQGGGNPQTHPIGDIGSQIMEGVQSASQARQARANAELTQAQKELLVAQKNDLLTITANRAKVSNWLPDRAMFQNQSAEARAIMDMLTQRQREATNLSDVQARLDRNELTKINTELGKLSLPEQRAVANYFQTFQGKHARTLDQILDVIRTIRGGGSKSYTTNNYIPGRR